MISKFSAYSSGLRNCALVATLFLAGCSAGGFDIGGINIRRGGADTEALSPDLARSDDAQVAQLYKIGRAHV